MKIFYVEDDRRWVRSLQEWLGKAFGIISADNLADAKAIFDERRSEFDTIILDGNLEGKTGDTLPLLRHIVASGFTGKIIAFSADSAAVVEMKRNGATLGFGKSDIKQLIDYLESQGK